MRLELVITNVTVFDELFHQKGEHSIKYLCWSKLFQRVVFGARDSLCAGVGCVREWEITGEGQGSIRTLLVMSPFGPHSIELAKQGFYQPSPRHSFEKSNMFLLSTSLSRASRNCLKVIWGVLYSHVVFVGCTQACIMYQTVDPFSSPHSGLPYVSALLLGMLHWQS